MTKNLRFFCAIMLLCACSSKEDLPDIDNKPEVNEDYYLATYIASPQNEILFDTESNHLYFFEYNEEYRGKMVCYNYQKNERVCDAQNPVNFIKKQISIGKHNGKSEIYLGDWNCLRIYDGNDLSFIDSIQVFLESDPRYIYSIDTEIPNLIFIGAGNAASLPNGVKDGSRVYNRTNKQLISEANWGPGHVKIKSYIHDQNTIGLIGIEAESSISNIYLDKFDKNGIFIETDIKIPSKTISSNLLKTNNNLDCFITSYDANLFSKQDLSFKNTLGGDYADIIINEAGNLFFCLSRDDKIVDIIEYPSLNKLGVIPLQNFAKKGFIDGHKLILVYFVENNKIYLSKLDVSEYLF